MKNKTIKTDKEVMAAFRKIYYDKNTPSGLNQKYPYFIKMVEDIQNFILEVRANDKKAIKSYRRIIR